MHEGGQKRPTPNWDQIFQNATTLPHTVYVMSIKLVILLRDVGSIPKYGVLTKRLYIPSKVQSNYHEVYVVAIELADLLYSCPIGY